MENPEGLGGGADHAIMKLIIFQHGSDKIKKNIVWSEMACNNSRRKNGMKNVFDLFCNTTDEEMLIIYKDVLKSADEGLRARSLDSFSLKLKEICHFEMMSQAAGFAEELFFKEIAKRYFRNISASNGDQK